MSDQERPALVATRRPFGLWSVGTFIRYRMNPNRLAHWARGYRSSRREIDRLAQFILDHHPGAISEPGPNSAVDVAIQLIECCHDTTGPEESAS